jgi:hypothetical protein
MVSRLLDLNRPRGPVPVVLVIKALRIGHEGVVDENGEMILGSKQRADVAMQCKIGLPGALDGLTHLRVGGMHQLSHLTAYLLLPERRASQCSRRCGSRSDMHSCHDDTTNPGTSVWLAGEDTSLRHQGGDAWRELGIPTMPVLT